MEKSNPWVSLVGVGLLFATATALAGNSHSLAPAASPAKPGVICATCDPPGGGSGNLPPPNHDDRAVFTEINPADHTEELDFGNGVVAIIDDSLDTVFIANQFGTSSFPLSEMFLDATNGDVQAAAFLRAQLHQRLTNPANVMQFGESDDGILGHATSSIPMLQNVPGGGPPTCSGFWNCAWFWMEWLGMRDLYWNYGMPDAGPSGLGDWGQWNQTQCQEEYRQMRHFVPEALGTGVACGALAADGATSTTLCLAGLGTLANTNYSMGRAIVNCHSVYRPH